MTEERVVLVHTCHESAKVADPRNLPQFVLSRKYFTDDPRFRSFLPLPVKCSCKKMVTKEKAEDFVKKGQALLVYKPPLLAAETMKDGHRLNRSSVDSTQIVKVVNRAQTPRVDLTTKAGIERAYISHNEDDIELIEQIHDMLVEGLRALIVPFVPDPLEGRLLFPFGPDQRTVGGH